jgi:hypothetical protein
MQMFIFWRVVPSADKVEMLRTAYKTSHLLYVCEIEIQICISLGDMLGREGK